MIAEVMKQLPLFLRTYMPLDAERISRTRIESLVGIVITCALLFLGAIWPSFFTLVAILALPAPCLFLLTAIYPKMLAGRPKLAMYLRGCVLVSLISWASEILFLIVFSRASIDWSWFTC